MLCIMHTDVAGKMSRTVIIDGLSEKESAISDPWSNLYQLMQSAAQQLQWKIGRLLHSEGSEVSLSLSLSLYIYIYIYISLSLSLCPSSLDL